MMYVGVLVFYLEIVMVFFFIFEFFDLCLCIKVVLIDVVEVIMLVF